MEDLLISQHSMSKWYQLGIIPLSIMHVICLDGFPPLLAVLAIGLAAAGCGRAAGLWLKIPD